MRPYFSRGHVRLAGPGHQERALEVHVHDGVPVVLGHLEDQVVADDAGVVDQHRRAGRARRRRARRRPRPGRHPSTSTPTPSALPPASRMPAATASQAASSRSSTPTANPSRASRCAVAAPMPRAAPVTMATRWVDMRTPRVRQWRAARLRARWRLPTLPSRRCRSPRRTVARFFMTSPREGRLHGTAAGPVRAESAAQQRRWSLTSHGRQPVEIWPGTAYPLGATYDGSGVNFALFTEVAERVELCLIDDDGAETRLDLPEVDGFVWHGYVPGLQPGQRYGFRVHGPYDPDRGPPLQPQQAAARPLRQGDRGPGRPTTRRCSPTTSRTPRSATPTTTWARRCSRSSSTRSSTGATTARRATSTTRRSSTRRTSRA